jgi:hypothetical protein
MANDVVGGVPVALSYCTLCGAAIPFLSQRSDGSQYTFGSSGLLYRSNKLMYDRQTNTLWNQLTGEPVMGELAGSDIRLEYAPIVLTTWKAWRSDHPDTLVLDINTGYYRLYVVGVPYGDYFASEDLMFPVWQRSDLLEEKTQIYALNINGIPKAYPISVLVSEGVINDVIGTTPVVLIAGSDSVTINGISARTGPVSYSAGAEVRAYDRGEWVFHSAPQSGEVLDSEGRQWQITEEALIGPDGEAAPRLPGHLAYWFGWFSFFPQTLVYGFE